MKKVCCKCKKNKNLDSFNKDKYRRDGFGCVCKACKKAARRNYYLANKDTIIKKQREKRIECQEWVRHYKKECKTCGESHPACLDFHHIGNKEAGIAKMIHKKNINEELKRKILIEIEKCEVLCSNCHRKLHWEERN
jgi:hypothetical protein